MEKEKIAFSVEEMAHIIGISRASAYELVKKPDFPSIRVGERRIIIPREGLERWLNEQSAATTREGARTNA